MAQLPPLADTTLQYMPASDVPEADGLRAQISSYDVQVNVPTQLGRNTFFIPGLQFHLDSVSYANEPPGFTPLNALFGIDMPMLLAHRVSERWTLSARAWPGVAGDLEKLDARALRVGALTMLNWSPGASFTTGGGGLVSYSFGELLPLPLVYVDWSPGPHFRLEASLPFFASATLRLAHRAELGLSADVGGNEYAIGSREIRERYPCVGSPDDPRTASDERRAPLASCVDHVAYSVIAAGADVRVRLLSSLWLSAFLGHTLYRRYDVQNDDGSSVPGGNVDLPNVPLLRLGLTFRIPEPDAVEARALR